MWLQRVITLNAKVRGFHLVTDELLAALPELRRYRVGLLHLCLQHTSASLSINEYTGVFFEQGILVAKAGYGSDLLTIPVCVAGQTGAAGIYCEGGSI